MVDSLENVKRVKDPAKSAIYKVLRCSTGELHKNQDEMYIFMPTRKCVRERKNKRYINIVRLYEWCGLFATMQKKKSALTLWSTVPLGPRPSQPPSPCIVLKGAGIGYLVA